MATVLLLAHQGGWDETLLVLVPIVVLGSLLALANRRANAALAQEAAAKAAAEPDDARAPDPDSD
jgi:hypothetical protein